MVAMTTVQFGYKENEWEWAFYSTSMLWNILMVLDERTRLEPKQLIFAMPFVCVAF